MIPDVSVRSSTWSVTPSGWLIGAAGPALAGLGAAIGYAELVVIGVTCVFALFFAVLHVARRVDMRATRTIPVTRVREGDVAQASLSVSNRGRRRSPPLLAADTVGERRVGVSLPSLRRGDEATARYRLPVDRRGAYQIGPLALARADPLRLMRRVTYDPTRPEFLVVPRVHPVEPVPTGESRDMDGPTNASSPQGGVAFHSLRDYVPGDDIRLIHWRSTARTGTLMVRHNVVPHEPRVAVVLDADASAYAGDAFEDAVRMAASLCIAICENGAPVRLRMTSLPEAPIDASPFGGSHDLLDRLAAVQHAQGAPGLGSVPRLVDPADGASLVVVSGRQGTSGLAALGDLRHRFGFVGVVRLGDGVGPHPVVGAVVVDGRTSAEAAAAWNRRVRR